MGSVVDWPVRQQRVMRCIACNRAMFQIARYPAMAEYHCPHADCAEFAVSWQLSTDVPGEQVMECVGRVLPAKKVNMPTFQQMGWIG